MVREPNIRRESLLKVDLHLHTAEDPIDKIRYTSRELIAKAAAKGFDVISITNHHRVTFDPGLFDYAREKGILLIPGIELTIHRRHVLVINPPANGTCTTFAALANLRRPETLIIAPHPFFPGSYSLNGYLSRHLHLFDALEYCHFYSRMINFNQKAVEVCRTFGFPLIGNSDAHFMTQFGSTYSLIYAEKTMEAVFAAIRQNRVQVVSRPLKHLEMGSIANRFLRMKIQATMRKRQSARNSRSKKFTHRGD